MRSNITRYIIPLFFLLVLIFAACKKLDIGFLSDGLYVPDSPIQLDRGTTLQTTSAIRIDGSTAPISFKLLDVRLVGSGKTAEEFYTPNQVYMYTQSIDPATDTTIELINKKRSLKEIPPFQFTTAGQFIFNAGTASLPLNATYEYDVEVTNPSGTKIINNIGLIHVIESEPFALESIACAWFRDFATDNGSLENPDISITKIADTGTNAIIKITDENGMPFNPKAGEIIARGDRPTFESYAKFHPIVYTDSTMICNFEVAPFPLQSIPSYGHLMYYRIPYQFADINADALPTSEAAYTHSVNPRFAFNLKKVGTYLVEIKLNGVYHK